jgi:D-alanine--poly(phosphoribitol) ligase subunit 1
MTIAGLAAKAVTADPCHRRLWAIFDGFQGDGRLAYSHPAGDLSFATLHRAVERLLPALAALPRAAQRRPILIWGHKDVRYPIAYWASLLAGQALVPVEPETPPERIRQIIATCDPSVILVADGAAPAPDLTGFASDGRLTVLPLADPQALADAPAGAVVRDLSIAAADVAYIMFSSGTLGQPKGIQVTYSNLLDFIDWLEPLLGPSALQGGVSGIIRHCFDVSLFELWASWTGKLSLCALDHATVSDSTGYIARLAAGRVSLWVSTPSLVRLFLRNRRFCRETLPDLTTFLFCGEPLTKPIVRELFARFGPSCRIVNTYGPTECTVAVTAVDITPQHLEAEDELPIGHARPGTQLCLPPGTPAGQAAELWISGASVGAGYIGLPEKQAQAFPRADLYRSGDLARVDGDGQWHFLGRIDREVKIQGLRIDLNEIEAHLRRQPGVEDAVVEPHIIHGEARALQAFVVGASSDAELANLASTLARELPPYLVPRFWYAGFPEALNLNSKLDRKLLADAAQSARLRHVHMAGPGTGTAPAEQNPAEQNKDYAP